MLEVIEDEGWARIWCDKHRPKAKGKYIAKVNYEWVLVSEKSKATFFETSQRAEVAMHNIAELIGINKRDFSFEER